jgi:hypothetical protein
MCLILFEMMAACSSDTLLLWQPTRLRIQEGHILKSTAVISSFHMIVKYVCLPQSVENVRCRALKRGMSLTWAFLPVRDKSGVCRLRYDTGRMWRSSAAATWEWSTSAEKSQDAISHVTEMILKWIKTGSVGLLQKAVTILTRLNLERR